MLRLVQKSACSYKSIRCLSTRLQVTFHVKLIEDKYTTNEYNVSTHIGTSVLTAINDNNSPFTVGTNEKATNPSILWNATASVARVSFAYRRNSNSKQPRSDDEVEPTESVHAE